MPNKTSVFKKKVYLVLIWIENVHEVEESVELTCHLNTCPSSTAPGVMAEIHPCVCVTGCTHPHHRDHTHTHTGVSHTHFQPELELQAPSKADLVELSSSSSCIRDND